MRAQIETQRRRWDVWLYQTCPRDPNSGTEQPVNNNSSKTLLMWDQLELSRCTCPPSLCLFKISQSNGYTCINPYLSDTWLLWSHQHSCNWIRSQHRCTSRCFRMVCCCTRLYLWTNTTRNEQTYAHHLTRRDDPSSVTNSQCSEHHRTKLHIRAQEATVYFVVVTQSSRKFDHQTTDKLS